MATINHMIAARFSFPHGSKKEPDLIECSKLGVNSYIQKPVDFDQFRETIPQAVLYWVVVNQAPPPSIYTSPEERNYGYA